MTEGTVQEKRPHFEAWLDRYEAIGRAQHRYMYLLLVLTAFFLVVDGCLGSSVPDTGNPLRIDFIQLEVSKPIVWALGPPIIAFVLLAFLGTFAAAKAALEGLDASAPPGLSGEAYDRVPNLIDFAVRTSGKDALPTRVLAASSYPAFATAVLLFVGLLVYRLFAHPVSSWLRGAVAVVTLLLCVPVVARLGRLWKRKMKSAVKAK